MSKALASEMCTLWFLLLSCSCKQGRSASGVAVQGPVPQPVMGANVGSELQDSDYEVTDRVRVEKPHGKASCRTELT